MANPGAVCVLIEKGEDCRYISWGLSGVINRIRTMLWSRSDYLEHLMRQIERIIAEVSEALKCSRIVEALRYLLGWTREARSCLKGRRFTTFELQMDGTCRSQLANIHSCNFTPEIQYPT